MTNRPANAMTAQQYRQMQGHKDPRRQYQGKLNHDLGQQFESIVDSACEWYLSASEADIEKTPEPLKVVKNLGNGKFLAVFTKKAQPDYKGTLKGGRSVLFDAKHTTTGQMEQSKVTPEQAAALERGSRMGATCFVLIGFDMQRFFRIPWTVWRDMKAVFGRKYVRPEELDEYRVTVGRSGVLLFLD